MKIVVVGCGAMGSIYAALLATSGHEVRVVDTNTAHVDAINTKGLRVWGASGDRIVNITATSTPTDEVADLVICAVKARFAEAAAASLAPMLGKHTIVLTIQNGLGSADVVAHHVGAHRLLVGVAQGFGASLPEPGIAHHNDMKAIRFGAYGELSYSKAVDIANLWASAGFDAAPVENIIAMQWEKLVCNAAYSAPCAVTGMTVGEMMHHPHMAAISQAAATEAFEVARALNIKLRFDDPVAEVRAFASRMPDAKPSVLLDVEAGRLSEVDVINGAVVSKALSVGLQAPVNATLTALVRTMEKSIS